MAIYIYYNLEIIKMFSSSLLVILNPDDRDKLEELHHRLKNREHQLSEAEVHGISRIDMDHVDNKILLEADRLYLVQ